LTDANLVRFLGHQVQDPQTVGLIAYSRVNQGPAAIKNCLQDLADHDRRFAVVDALTDDHLRKIDEACDGLKLITGGSGVAMGLPDNFRRAGKLSETGGLVEKAVRELVRQELFYLTLMKFAS